MQGKRHRSPGRFRSPGLIPAHAGKTGRRCPPWGPTGAHPRSCGENRFTICRRRPALGSSPLTRGKHRRPLRRRPEIRLIPAHAGKTAWTSAKSPWFPAHPRSRGENRDGVLKSMSIGGSSPLTRGKQTAGSISHMIRGLIPAHTGKTKPSLPQHPSEQAHPRSRGENGFDRLAEAAGNGSSPLMRGKHVRSDVDVVAAGLIPAHAGKTSRVVAARGRVTAHPRSRGENRAGCACVEGGGSSPLTRGKRGNPAAAGLDNRLIPAHAGKTK